MPKLKSAPKKGVSRYVPQLLMMTSHVIIFIIGVVHTSGENNHSEVSGVIKVHLASLRLVQ